MINHSNLRIKGETLILLEKFMGCMVNCKLVWKSL